MRAVGMMVVTTFQHVACTMLHFAPCKTSGTRSVGGPSLLVHLGVCFLTGTSWVAFFWMRGKACAASKTLCVVLSATVGPGGDAISLWQLLHGLCRGGCPLQGVWHHA